MSNTFPLPSDAFSGGSNLTAQQDEGYGPGPLFALMNSAVLEAEAATALTAALDLSAATAAVVAAQNRQLTTNTGAARTYTLPAFASAPDGWSHTFISLDGTSNDFIIANAGTDTINGIDGSITLDATMAWCQVFKVPGATGWYSIGATGQTPA